MKSEVQLNKLIVAGSFGAIGWITLLQRAQTGAHWACLILEVFAALCWAATVMLVVHVVYTGKVWWRI